MEYEIITEFNEVTKQYEKFKVPICANCGWELIGEAYEHNDEIYCFDCAKEIVLSDIKVSVEIERIYEE